TSIKTITYLSDTGCLEIQGASLKIRRLRFSGPKTSIICTPMTSLKTSIKTITYLSDTGCLEIQGASLVNSRPVTLSVWFTVTSSTTLL
ncbi:hypothetical protein, partial [Shigella sonnei]|uniref:hypothetical protein n=1 Tax=Shigella sonnei TaxID=624 RepID=UPI00097D4A29